MKKKIFALGLAASLFLAGCGGTGGGSASENPSDAGSTLVKVGIVGSDSKTWDYIKTEAAKKNIEIEVVYFDSYPLPNAALDAGEIDLNAFQHHSYLNADVGRHGYKIEAIADTVIAPLGIYSKQIESLDLLEDGAKITIPDDETNGGRALLLLQEKGLITVDPEAGALPTLKDIENPRNFEIIELAAANTPASLEEVPISVINSGIATDAGFTPSEDAIVLESVKDGENLYVNIIAARSEEKDNPVFQTIIDLYHTDAVKDIIAEDSKGSSIPVW